MTAGQWMEISVIRMNQSADDVVGGAVMTGTVVYRCIPARFQWNAPSQLLLGQGLETEKIVSAIVRSQVAGVNLTIFERDELEITGPAVHPEVGNRFRVVSVQSQPTHPNDSRGLIGLRLSRWVRTRSEQ